MQNYGIIVKKRGGKRMEKQLFVILFFILSAVLFFFAVLFFLAARAFDAANEKESKWVGRTPASLVATKHKKDVTIYGRDRLHGPVKSYFIKNLTKGTYVYTVNGKQYKRRVIKYFTTPRQMPYLSTSFYIKLFPRSAYLKADLQLYDVYAIGCLGFAVAFLLGALKGLSLLV